MFALLAAALAAAVVSSSAPLDAVPQTRLDGDLRCLLGVYTLPKGQSVIITGLDGQPRGLRYTLANGQFGKLQPDAAGAYIAKGLAIRFEPCVTGRMSLTRDSAPEAGVHLPLVETDTTFMNGDVKLHGKLVMPPNGQAKALAVWVEGSNNDPSTDDTIWQYALAQRGVAVFVYDKRGTGTSEGALSADFHIRAQDTVAAVAEARRLAPKVRQVGVIGGSQGGWVAPLTATLTSVDFVIPAFAMAEGPIAQDRELVQDQLRQAGFSGDALAQAAELTAITERIVRANLNDGFAELEAFKARYADAAWLKAVQPRSYTGLFLKLSTADIKSAGPAAAQGLSFEYEPRPVIEQIKPRQLWLLGGSDHQAPNAGTQDILRQIQGQRPDIAVVVFPNADHGLIETTKTPDGTVKSYSMGLFDVTAAWIKDKRLPAAGTFIVMPASKD